MKLKIVLLSTLLTLNLYALIVGEVPKGVVIDGDNGGLVTNDKGWNSSSIKEKVLIMFYVDPDEKDTNSHYSAILKEKAYNRTNFGSIAIINMAATWKPNFAIESILESKQEEFPNTIYVKDKKSLLIKEWEIEDDASNILIFSKDSKLLFYKSGKMGEEDIKSALKLIEENM